MFLYILYLLLLLQFQLQSNACLFVCFAPQQSFNSVNNVHFCHHDALPSKCNRNTNAIRQWQWQSEHHSSSNYNRSAVRRQWQWQSGHTDNNMAITKNTDQQQSFIINNNVDTSAIKSIANTSFPPSATGRPTRSNNGNRDTQITTQQSQNGIPDQQATTFHQHGRAGECREWKYMQVSINIFVAMTTFPPSATKTPQQQQQLQPERDPAMAGVAIVT